MSIIITPGTFAPPPAPGVLRVGYWPEFPAPRRINPKQDMQFSTRWQEDASGPPPSGDFDDSPMVTTGVRGWISRLTSTLWAHQRMITMRAEWVGMPPEVTHIAVWYEPKPVSDGSAELDVSDSFQIQDSVDWIGEDTGYDQWSPLLEGLEFSANGATNHGELVYDTVGDVDRSIALATTAANAFLLKVMNGPTALATFYVSPVYESAIELGADYDEISIQASPRSVRVVWSAEDGYSLLTPAGFLVSQS